MLCQVLNDLFQNFGVAAPVSLELHTKQDIGTKRMGETCPSKERGPAVRRPRKAQANLPEQFDFNSILIVAEHSVHREIIVESIIRFALQIYCGNEI